MVEGLVLYTNGKCEVRDLRESDYRNVVRGFFEMLPSEDGYVDPQKRKVRSRPRLTCIVNEEGALHNMESNPYSVVLSLLGIRVHPTHVIYGNVIVFSEGKNREKTIDPYIVKLFDDYNACENKDEFYEALAVLNKREN